MSSYGASDSFGSTPSTAPRLVDARTGITWVLGFGTITNGVPAAVWVLYGNWAVAKQRLGSTWAQAKVGGLTWGQAKALVAA